MPRSPSTILVVDDDPTNRQVMAWLFREAGYLVREAATGTEALRLARAKSPPDLLVLDINLPDLSGFEVCRQLRESPATATIAVVHLSAVHVGSNARVQGLDQGADAYLVKPVDPDELLATVRAILRIRHAEEAARRAAGEWRATFDALSDAVAVIDDKGTITRANQALSDLLGVPFSEMLGLPLEPTLRKSLCAKADSPPLDWLLEAGLGSRTAEEVSLGERHLRIVVDPIPSGGSVVIVRDITPQRELEEQVRRSQRLEAVGQLSAGVAHELNNLLAVVIGNLSLISGLTHDPADCEALETAQRSVFRVAELTQQLQGFAQQTLLWLQPVQPERVVEEALAELLPELPPGVALRRDLAAKPPSIQADPKLLKIVLLQLCRRALRNLTLSGQERSQEGVGAPLQAPGEVRVSLRSAHFAQPTEDGRPEVRPGTFILLSVADTGPVLPPEAVRRIFEPFHSPHDPFGGLALGMVHGIVKQHLGWIECVSAPDQGTRFDLYLPALTESLPSSRPIPTKVVPRPGPRRILLADDNQTLLSLATHFLRQDGYEVLTATDGQDAIDLFRREAGRIDLVILDQVMPECSGPDALSQMRLRSPRLRALIATDASDSVRLRQSEIQGIVCKPYRERELLQAVREALRREA